MTRSAGPPTGDGPDSATATAVAPARSGPATASPVIVQPGSSGIGAQTGTVACSATWRSASALALGRTRNGDTAPCRSQTQSLDIRPGARSPAPQRGQVQGTLTRPRS